MTIQEIKVAILAGKTVCLISSSYVVKLESVNPLYELSVSGVRNSTVTALEPNDYADCFIYGE